MGADRPKRPSKGKRPGKKERPEKDSEEAEESEEAPVAEVKEEEKKDLDSVLAAVLETKTCKDGSKPDALAKRRNDADARASDHREARVKERARRRAVRKIRNDERMPDGVSR